eukprot:UN34904
MDLSRDILSMSDDELIIENKMSDEEIILENKINNENDLQKVVQIRSRLKNIKITDHPSGSSTALLSGTPYSHTLSPCSFNSTDTLSNPQTSSSTIITDGEMILEESDLIYRTMYSM